MFPSLFQIAAFFEDFFPNSGFPQSLPAVKHLPFANLMSSPEKLMAALKSGSSDEGAADRPRGKSSSAAKRSARSAAPNPSPKRGEEDPGKLPDPQQLRESSNVKKVQFVLDAPAASSVKLAADFTEWEKSPVEMLHSNDGKWSAEIPLPPGQYAYRYIVDGQWFDDPASTRHAPNPFGSENAVITVA
ncbi:MAG TPA: isoamylase early set domain-containing protein [Verrucomicrobiae bacterium]